MTTLVLILGGYWLIGLILILTAMYLDKQSRMSLADLLIAAPIGACFWPLGVGVLIEVLYGALDKIVIRK